MHIAHHKLVFAKNSDFYCIFLYDFAFNGFAINYLFSHLQIAINN